MEEKQIIELPPPLTDLTFPLMKALRERRTIRKWKPDPIGLQDISNLLYGRLAVSQKRKRARPKVNGQRPPAVTPRKSGSTFS